MKQKSSSAVKGSLCNHLDKTFLLGHREAPLFLKVKVSTFLIGQVVIQKICSYLSNLHVVRNLLFYRLCKKGYLNGLTLKTAGLKTNQFYFDKPALGQKGTNPALSMQLQRVAIEASSFKMTRKKET